MKFREKLDRLVVALLDATQAEPQSRYFPLRTIADSIDLPRSTGELRQLGHGLESEGLVDASFTAGDGDEGGISVRLLSGGWEAAERILLAHPSYSARARPKQTSHSEKRIQLLVALYREGASSDISAYFDLRTVADAAGIVREGGELRLAATWLKEHGAIDLSMTLGGGEEGGMAARLTGRGIELAEEYLEEEHPTGDVGSVAPASDRYVRLTDNQRSELTHLLAELIEGVRQSNEVSPEDREIALSEIAAFEATLAQPCVAVDLMERFATRVLNWMAVIFCETVVVGVIGEAAKNLLALAAG